ncbi:hypothetical protein GQX74_006830 [Glossina fuscipes]|nr:hypothetical protein GQX74_006830 [Glossina fuscipes]
MMDGMALNTHCARKICKKMFHAWQICPTYCTRLQDTKRLLYNDLTTARYDAQSLKNIHLNYLSKRRFNMRFFLISHASNSIGLNVTQYQMPLLSIADGTQGLLRLAMGLNSSPAASLFPANNVLLLIICKGTAYSVILAIGWKYKYCSSKLKPIIPSIRLKGWPATVCVPKSGSGYINLFSTRHAASFP